MVEIKLVKSFCRRRKDIGIYTGNVNGRVIRLVDRQIYSPKDPREIKFLLADPEIEVLCSDQKEQEIENDRNDQK